MAESSDSSPLGFLWRHFEGVKEHWKSNFSFLDYYKKTLGRKEPLPKWTDADVEEFIASDPIYGPQLQAIRESRKYAVAGALLGGAHLGGVSLKYSKSPHGFVLATGFGALCGGVLGMEVAEHWKQLYKIDKQAANLRFLYWWEDKTLGSQRN
ncbi:succinate dehydrogenase subunit 6, mitochondrial-like [Zingiber officinale]|uniref:succinate dehydrogenase subunit 6, mitochondrial-like n=1 Tax=Zingiber officinale TaxID=94328 RepID=UPI001C4A8431|nr:succinate dehydrogenase subunit 6, mitochondrial-like [Zingiber officinale]XP_042384272.1 succinate dehydrogenase subunit 6, mitochondrial-like [Zingiber officinale]